MSSLFNSSSSTAILPWRKRATSKKGKGKNKRRKKEGKGEPKERGEGEGNGGIGDKRPQHQALKRLEDMILRSLDFLKKKNQLCPDFESISIGLRSKNLFSCFSRELFFCPDFRFSLPRLLRPLSLDLLLPSTRLINLSTLLPFFPSSSLPPPFFVPLFQNQCIFIFQLCISSSCGLFSGWPLGRFLSKLFDFLWKNK